MMKEKACNSGCSEGVWAGSLCSSRHAQGNITLFHSHPNTKAYVYRNETFIIFNTISILSPGSGFSDFNRRKWPSDMELSFECVEWVVTDGRQGVILQSGDWKGLACDGTLLMCSACIWSSHFRPRHSQWGRAITFWYIWHFSHAKVNGHFGRTYRLHF
jgi:hypothetical protein